MTRAKKFRVELVVFFVGVLVGVGGLLYVINNLESTPEDIEHLSQTVWLQSWNSHAKYAQLHDDPKIADWTLRAYIDLLEKDVAGTGDTADPLALRGSDLAFAYMRLALVAKAQGDTSEFQVAIERALTLAKPHAVFPKFETADQVLVYTRLNSTFSPAIEQRAFGTPDTGDTHHHHGVEPHGKNSSLEALLPAAP